MKHTEISRPVPYEAPQAKLEQIALAQQILQGSVFNEDGNQLFDREEEEDW